MRRILVRSYFRLVRTDTPCLQGGSSLWRAAQIEPLNASLFGRIPVSILPSGTYYWGSWQRQQDPSQTTISGLPSSIFPKVQPAKRNTITSGCGHCARVEHRSGHWWFKFIRFFGEFAAIATGQQSISRSSEREDWRPLERALSEVRTLRSLLPICAHCRKVRDDAGLWIKFDVCPIIPIRASVTDSVPTASASCIRKMRTRLSNRCMQKRLRKSHRLRGWCPKRLTHDFSGTQYFGTNGDGICYAT